MWQVIVILVCLAINGLLAATELAFVSVSKARLKKLSNEGSKSAQRVLNLRENPEKTLSVLQLGITFIGGVAAAVGGAGIDQWATPWLIETFNIPGGFGEILAILLFVIPYTYLNVVLSELLPKSLALRNPKKVIFNTSHYLVILQKIFAPIVVLLEKSTKLGAKLCSSWFKIEEPEMEEPIFVGKLTRPYMLNLARIEGQYVDTAMIPWKETDTISIDAPIQEVKEKILKKGHTRLPIVKGEEPIGVLLSKEFIVFYEKGDPNWQVLLKPIIKVSEKDSLIHALRIMQSERSHLSLVLRKGLPIGIVTIEDILEEIVGEIYDEDDRLLK